MGRGRRAGERQLRGWIEQVREGRLPRRDFIARLGALGVAAPMAGLMLLDAGVAQAQPAFSYTPTKRGGGGTLRLLEWQGPTLLNPHFATGVKDGTGSRIFYEPLAEWGRRSQPAAGAGRRDPQPRQRRPGRRRKERGLEAEARVTWHDGQPFTADDVVFNWQFATDPATAAVTAGNYQHLKIEKIDTHTVRVVFDKPAPFWPGLYSQSLLVPRHLFAAYSGSRSREAPANHAPVGTGPYRFVAFKPADSLSAELNPGYHVPNRPHFDRLEMKAGGDATSAARAVLQTGEYDYAGTLVVEDEVLKRLEAGGKGRVAFTSGSSTTARLPELHRPGRRSRRRALACEDAPPAVRRPGGAAGDVAAGRPRQHPGLHLRPLGRGQRQLHQQPGALPKHPAAARVQHRESPPGARRLRLEARPRRRAREERPARSTCCSRRPSAR